MKRKLFFRLTLISMLTVAFVTSSSAQAKISAASLDSLRSMKPPNGKALVYLLRPYNFMGSLLSIFLTCNEKNIGSVRVKGFIYTILDTGQYKFTAISEGRTNLNLSVQANHTYFIKVKVPLGLEMIDEGPARELLGRSLLSKDCRAYSSTK
jgi:hypothetical protein